MSQISIIKKSEIEEAKRFDAEYFKPEYLEIEKKLDNRKTDTFEKFSDFYKEDCLFDTLLFLI